MPFADVAPIKIPDGIPEQKVLFLSDIFPTGYMAAENCGIEPGDTVAVWGCGPVGQFAMQSAWMLGAGCVIAIDRVPQRLRMAEQHSKAETINFDDGTLVDSNGAHAAAWSDAFAAHGRRHPPEQVRPLIGKGGDKLLRELASLNDEFGEGRRIAEARVEIFRNRYLPTLKPTPGAVAFVAWLLKSRLTVVVATSAKEDEVKALLTICGGQALVKDAMTSDNAERSKPHPDILVTALEKSGSSPDRAIMIGDTPYDIEAARRAGLATIAFRCVVGDAALHSLVAYSKRLSTIRTCTSRTAK